MHSEYYFKVCQIACYFLSNRNFWRSPRCCGKQHHEHSLLANKGHLEITFREQGSHWVLGGIGEHWFHKLQEKGSWQNWTLGKMRNYLRGLEGETSVIQRTREHKPTMGGTIFPAPFNEKFQNSATWNITEWKGQFRKKFSDICVCLPRLSSLSQFLLHVHNRHSKMKGKGQFIQMHKHHILKHPFHPLFFQTPAMKAKFYVTSLRKPFCWIRGTVIGYFLPR